MTGQELFSEAEQLVSRISAASQDQRLALQPQFSEVLARLKERGVQVPQRLRRLDEALMDEVLEAQFDNMPV